MWVSHMRMLKGLETWRRQPQKYCAHKQQNAYLGEINGQLGQKSWSKPKAEELQTQGIWQPVARTRRVGHEFQRRIC